MQWNSGVENILTTQGRDFARIKTPHGWRTLAKKHLLPKEKKRLEGSCFEIALRLALSDPKHYWYCEGLAHNLPHAWVALKEFDVDWCLDLTWPFYTFKKGYQEHDNLRYTGVRFDVQDVKSFMLNRMKERGRGSTSLSMLKYPNEIVSLIK
jgi:hypothetical protein